MGCPYFGKLFSALVPMKIATFNVNNINRRLPNLLQWLKTAQPHIVCLAWGRFLSSESGAGAGPQLSAGPAASPSRRFILAVGGGRGYRGDTPSPQRL